ncbi:MAG TPA: hypothetical protein EYQ25_10175 [Planctomycetes bacterium]|nr:hypothetical protein [Planctomycetota bacterium]HIL38449.1 hypothetical protein [Planctomycetota bacterium]
MSVALRCWLSLALGLGIGLFLISCGPGNEPKQAQAWPLELLRHLGPLAPLPPDPTNRVADDPAAAHYGQWLFFDKRLSGDGKVSCSTCHDPDHGFSDSRSIALGRSLGERHAPTVIGAAYQRWLGWGGRADSLWMQALGPMENVVEMAGDRNAIAALVRQDPDLRRAHQDAFGELPEDVDALFVQLGKAIAAYERLLIRKGSPFDRWVRATLDLPDGDPEAMNAKQLRGLRLFLGPGRCTLCHLGPTFSDLEFHNNQLPAHAEGPRDDPGRYRGAELVQTSPFNAAGPHSDAPNGEAAQRVRALVQTSESYGEFRTPTLRNLARRTPYGHQGQFPDLSSVLKFYNTLEDQDLRSHHQEQLLRPLRLDQASLDALEAFLLALEGADLPEELTRAPTAPFRDQDH